MLHFCKNQGQFSSQPFQTRNSTSGQKFSGMKLFSGFLIALSLITILAVSPRVSYAQSTGEITGLVTDHTGAAVANATVTNTELATQETRAVKSNASGLYDFPNLNPGRYSVTITAPGFRTTTTDAFDILAGDRHRADVTLEVGAATQTVEVQTTSEALQTDSSIVNHSVTSMAVDNMPLNGRNYAQLVQLVPGATQGTPTALDSGQAPDDRRQGTNVSVDDQSDSLNNNQIDGLDNNERMIGSVGVHPSLDDIQEMKVLTNNYSADSGRSAGAIINIITKGGTNSFHGSVYEYLRNDIFNAYAYQFGAHNKKPEWRQNQFGGSIGGPIRKDKTFFFGDFEGFRLVQGLNPSTATVPTTFEINNPGNFSDITGATAAVCNPGGTPIASPSSYKNGCAYNPATGMQYTGNIIPGGSIDPVGADYLKLYPTLDGVTPGHLASNFPGGAASATGQVSYVNAFTQLQNFEVFDIRVDHQISASDSLFGRYSENNYYTYVPQAAMPSEMVAGVLVNGQTGVNGPANQNAENGQINYTHIFTSALLFQGGAGWTRYYNLAQPPNYGLNPNKAFGEPGINYGPIQDSALGGATPGGGLTGFGAGRPGFVPLSYKDDTYQAAGSVFYLKGKHAYKFGGALIRRQFYNFQEQDGMGNITFVNGAPGLLTGYFNTALRVSTNYQGVELGSYFRSWEPSFFVGDDWRITPKLTLNLGVRYDIFTPNVEKFNHLSNFMPSYGGQLVIAGQTATRSADVPIDFDDWQPRLGFAFNPGAGFVVRGGFGLSFFPTGYASVSRLLDQPFIFSLSCSNGGLATVAGYTGNCPLGTGGFGTTGGYGFIAEGLPAPGTVNPAFTAFNCITTAQYNAAVAQGVTPAVLPNSSSCYPQAISSSSPRYKDGYLEQFNLTVQKAFYKNVLTVTYVGALGRRLGDALADTNLAPIGNLSAPNATKENDTRAFYLNNPNLTTVPAMPSDGSSAYEGLQTSIERRTSNGLGYMASYVWSHELDNVAEVGAGGTTSAINLTPGPWSSGYHHLYDWGSGPDDQRNRFVFEGSYAPQVFKNRHDVVGQVAGGWTGSILTVWTTGLPFGVTNPSSFSLVSPQVTSDRPNIIGNPKANIPAAPAIGLIPYFNPCWSNANLTTVAGQTQGSIGGQSCPAVFQAQAYGTAGSSHRDMMAGPSAQHVDITLAKSFPIHENLHLNFRAEGYNMLNSVTFGNPNTGLNLNSSNAGFITTTRADYNPRVWQFAMRVEF